MSPRAKKWLKRLGYFCLFMTILLIVLWLCFLYAIKIPPPKIEDMSAMQQERVKVSDDFYYIGNNWLKKNKHGLWEVYLEGKPFEIGAVNGKLTEELTLQLEESFIDEMKNFVPSESALQYFKYFIGWFNRKMPEYIPLEYQEEIYGASLSANNTYDFVGPKYQRVLNYHGAHDIGHALQNMGRVGCTSFASWGDRSADSSMVIGRNFDFYVGDGFAKNKVISFINPDKGHQFMMIAWAGMSGVVSGMNEKGLTITLNAAPSEIPTHGKTPISILAREILQYSENIEEAYEIAQKRKTFVSETLMIGSATDNTTALIEKSTEKTALYYTELQDHIICSNHYQSDEFDSHELNNEHIVNSHSDYRYKRMTQLMAQYPKMDANKAAKILRDKGGINDADIGLGNEKSINQLIAHHAVIFKPKERIVWVSVPPYMLGGFVAYDLNKIFNEYKGLKKPIEITEDSLEIAADPFLASEEFIQYEQFRIMKKKIEDEIDKGGKAQLDDAFIQKFISSNPNFYMVYDLIGDYYAEKGNCNKAIEYYVLSLDREVTTLIEKNELEEKVQKGCPY